MIEINVQDNNKMIVIFSDNPLDNVTKSQLSFWNFKYDFILNHYYTENEHNTFLKIVKYFEKENLAFKLSKEAMSFSKELEVINSNFENLRKNALEYKNGNFNQLDFSAFRSFTAENIKRTLKIHQLKAAYHMYILGNAANFSVPGSGKTSVVLTVYEKLKNEGKVNTLFVIGPPSSFGPWRNEFNETLGRIPQYTILAGGNKSQRKNKYYEIPENATELYLISFQTLLSDKSEVNHFLKQKHVKAFLVVDEAHYMKQIKGNWAQAILQQSERASYRCVLTGTPMPKSYSDLFNLFDFLWPNIQPISSGDKIRVKNYESIGNTSLIKNILDKNIGPLFYRVRKSDLNLKQQNFISPYLIEMGDYERKIYNAIYSRIKNYSKEDYFRNITFINKVAKGRIIRLRQCVSYPKLLENTIDDYNEDLYEDLSDLRLIIKRYDDLEIPAKLLYLLKIISELQAKKLKVVIWSNFIDTIKLIEKKIKDAGYNCKIIYGNTPIEGNVIIEEETREKIRDEFVELNSGLDILIANPAACAESISLHKTCHHAVYYDLTYNCAQFLQSLDRIHRVGGSEYIEANYHFLQYKNTIDKDIKDNIERKTKKMFEVIEEDYSIYSLDMNEPDGDAEAYKRLFNSKKKEKKKE